MNHAIFEKIKKAAEIIKSGGLVIFPTETVYGIGADALNPDAVAKIFEAKKRPFFDPLICHVSDLQMAEKISHNFPEKLKLITEKFWPGPLTVIVKKKETVSDLVTSGLDTVAVRMPLNEIARELIKLSETPIAAPSANLFGGLSPTKYEHTLILKDSVGMIIDGGACSIGLESTILKEENNRLYILRPGGITREEIEETIQEKVELVFTEDLPEAPGLLKNHYSPDAEVVLIEEGSDLHLSTEKSCLLSFRKNTRRNSFLSVEILSTEGDLRKAATNLFSALHRLDAFHPDTIYAEKVPEVGLGLAIMNRLRKASG